MKQESQRRVTFLVQEELGEPLPLGTLPVVAVEATEHHRVNDLGARAFEAAGFGHLESARILFVEPRGDGDALQLALPPDVAVDGDGRMFWRVGVGSAATTIGDLERAAAEGLFVGDPYTYWVGRGGWGDSGIFVSWDDLVRFLDQLGGVAAGVAVVGAVAQRLLQVVAKHLRRWEARHARFPDTFFNSVIRRPEWDPPKLARLLDVPEDDARDLLVSIGYAEGADGTYRLTNDPDKAHLRKRLAERHFLFDGWQEPGSSASDQEPPT